MWTVPNLLTLLNLYAGIVGIYCVLTAQPMGALYAIGVSLLADYLDGLFARWLNITNSIGKDLDSLADVVSFGVLPSLMLLELLQNEIDIPGLMSYLPFAAFLFALFGAMRLAKFNQDQRSADHFYGLPIPSAAIYLAGLYWLAHSTDCSACSSIFINPLVLCISLILLCFLMVSDLPHFDLKFNGWQWKHQEVKWLFIVLSLGLALFLRQLAVPFAVVLYIFLSLLNYSSRPGSHTR